MIRNETEYQEASARLADERKRLAEQRARLQETGLAEDKDNLTRVIGFAGTYDTESQFCADHYLALTAYFVAELASYIAAHAKHPQSPSAVFADLAAFVTIRPDISQHTQNLPRSSFRP